MYIRTYMHTYMHTYVCMYNNIRVVELDVMSKSIVEHNFTIDGCSISHECHMLSTSVASKLFPCCY